MPIHEFKSFFTEFPVAAADFRYELSEAESNFYEPPGISCKKFKKMKIKKNYSTIAWIKVDI